jgi:cell division protein ZipA
MEAEGLRWSLLVIGSLVIVGLAVHGIWLSRKNSESKTNTGKHKKEQEYQPSGWDTDTHELDDVIDNTSDAIDENLNMNFDIGTGTGKDTIAFNSANAESKENDYNYDDLGLGEVRVVSDEVKNDAEAQHSPSNEIILEPEISPSKIYASVVTRPKPEYASKYDSSVTATGSISKQARATSNNSYRSNDHYEAPEPPPFLLKKDVSQPESESDHDVEADEQTNASYLLDEGQKNVVGKTHTTLAEKLSLSEQARNLSKHNKADPVNHRLEPKFTENQMGIDFDEQQTVKLEPKEELKKEIKQEPIVESKTKSTKPEQPQEVLVLNVKSAEDNPIPGSALLPMLLTLGFKFGEQDIFHRHININGKGPVLFSLANMFKPGNFDIDNLENFTTGGISLFMILPIEGEPHQVFNMMHNAARKIADEFSAQIYDGRRALLTKQSLQQYVEKIREFERQRILRG